MSRVSKHKAEEISKALTVKHVNQKKELEQEISDAIVEAYMKTVPKKVKDLFDSHPDWISTQRYIRLRGRGFNHKNINLKSGVPTTGMLSCEVFSDEDMAKFRKIVDKIEDKEKEIKELQLEIKSAVLALRTEKRVRENFPEAGKFLGADSTLLPAVNIDDLRKKLNK